MFLAMLVVSRRASGYLPLTRASSRQVALSTWVPGGLVIATVVLWILGIIVAVSSYNETASAFAGDIFILSALTFVLRNVHPAFVAAVQQMHQSRAALHASMYAVQNVPLHPGSNLG
ncbi:MAG TPA: hypothetical protein VGK42_11550 [Candidatus Dormibacteraeota bacterium]